jgi:hypothetical protein
MPMSSDAAVIVNSGSTNTAGFRIVVEHSGKATYTSTGRRQPNGSSANRNVDLPKALATRFYADLAAAKPFSQLPIPHCMKSASFGYALTIEFAGQTTPDLTCGDQGNAKMKALIQDSGEIVKLFQ